MNTEQMIKIMQAYVVGAEIQISIDGISFYNITNPKWDWGKHTYRIKPMKPSINWDHVALEYNYLAMDKDGDSYIYQQKPITENDWWVPPDDSNYLAARGFASFSPGNCDWGDSMICRPEVIE